MVNNLMINYCSGLSAARGLMMTGSMISFGPGSGMARGSSFFSSGSGEVGRVSMGSWLGLDVDGGDLVSLGVVWWALSMLRYFLSFTILARIIFNLIILACSVINFNVFNVCHSILSASSFSMIAGRGCLLLTRYFNFQYSSLR